jgi:hypothetical protein
MKSGIFERIITIDKHLVKLTKKNKEDLNK